MKNKYIKLSKYIFCPVFITTLAIVLGVSVNINVGLASSYSSNYILNDESLNFGSSAGLLESSSYSSDLNDLYWTERNLSSSSYKIVDSNSKIVDASPSPPPSPLPPSEGAGGRAPPLGNDEYDKAILTSERIPEVPEKKLHLAPESEAIKIPKDPILKPAPMFEVEYLIEDNDGCSPAFENKFLGTNPYLNDTDKDGIWDCREALIYGLDPNNFDDTHGNVGVAQIIKMVYTQENPFFVGRIDFGSDYMKSNELQTQAQIDIFRKEFSEKIGSVAINYNEDLNFAIFSDVKLEDGVYELNFILDCLKQSVSNMIEIDSKKEYVELTVEISEEKILKTDGDNHILLKGKTGVDYGIVAIWQTEEFIDVTAVVSDSEGSFIINSPKVYDDGEYEVTLYALRMVDQYEIIQTNYKNIKFIVENENIFIKEDDLNYSGLFAASLMTPIASGEAESDRAKIVSIEANLSYSYWLILLILISFSSLSVHIICKIRNR